MSAEVEALAESAWEQHDLYAGESGTEVRKDIVAEAIADMGKLQVTPARPQGHIPYILRKAYGTGPMTAELLVEQTRGTQTEKFGHHIGMLAFFNADLDFNPRAVGKAMSALLPIHEGAMQDKLLDAHRAWTANDASRVLPEISADETLTLAPERPLQLVS
jgi:hypothetical protein